MEVTIRVEGLPKSPVDATYTIHVGFNGYAWWFERS